MSEQKKKAERKSVSLDEYRVAWLYLSTRVGEDYKTNRTSNNPVAPDELLAWLKGLSDEDFRKVAFSMVLAKVML